MNSLENAVLRGMVQSERSGISPAFGKAVVWRQMSRGSSVQGTVLAPSAYMHRSCGSLQTIRLCVAVDHGNDWQCWCWI